MSALQAHELGVSCFLEEEIGASESFGNIPEVIPRGKWWSQDSDLYNAGSKHGL